MERYQQEDQQWKSETDEHEYHGYGGKHQQIENGTIVEIRA